MRCGRLWAEFRWLVHALEPKTNELRRRTDRVMATLTACLVALGMLAVPAATAVGNITYEQQSRAAAVASATRRHVDAVQVDGTQHIVGADTPSGHGSLSWANVRWTGRGGQPRLAHVAVPSDSTVGSRVSVWVDTEDRITSPPPSRTDAAGTAVIAGLLTLAGLEAALFAIGAGLRRAVDTHTRRSWEREWTVIEPQWRHRKP